MEICRKLISAAPAEGGALVLLDHAVMRVYFMTDRILRLRVHFYDSSAHTPADAAGSFTDAAADLPADASYILQTTAWEDRLDGLFEGERIRLAPLSVKIEDREDCVLLCTDALKLTLYKDPLEILLCDAEGCELYRSIAGNPFVRDSNNRITHYSRMEDDDCFYGFGEKGGPLDKNREFIRERATDSWAYDPVKCDTMYKHIPFYIRLRRKDARALGVYYNNFYESVFNMGKELSNYWPHYTYWQADGGEIDLFLMAGPEIRTILDDYTLITGRPVLLPRRGLGYQGSSMYYSELEKDSDKALITFVDTAREKGFPIDGFHLSSGYTSQECGRCVFTWNHERFPDPEGYFAAMNERGAQNVPNIKPGILLGHPLFGEFLDKDVFVKDSADPEKPAVGPWWGGPGAFWDFTNPSARKAWKEYLTRQVIAVGTESIWDDNCEYDSLLDHEARCDYDGQGGTIGELKPIMCTLMSRLAVEAVREYNGKRAYVVCRSGSSGIQKYAQNWVGDNFTSWQTLRHNLPTILGVSLSGQPNTGADIGGFAGPAPGEELLVRWVQNGIFQPRFSIHSSSNDNTVTEPWMYSGSCDRIRDAILLRYRMLPHLYSLEWEAHETGAPIMRPLVFEFQKDQKVYNIDDTFLFGRDLLVANVLEEGAAEREVYLPEGACWYSLEEHFACYEGGQTIRVPVTLDSIPRFIRSGGILPMSRNQLYNMEKDRVEALDLLLASPCKEGGESEYLLYDDDGTTNDYESGVYRKTLIRLAGGEVTRISFSSEGSFETAIRELYVTLIRRDMCPYWVKVQGEVLPHFLDRVKFEKAGAGWYYSQTGRSVEIHCSWPAEDFEIQISFEDMDLLKM